MEKQKNEFQEFLEFVLKRGLVVPSDLEKITIQELGWLLQDKDPMAEWDFLSSRFKEEAEKK